MDTKKNLTVNAPVGIAILLAICVFGSLFLFLKTTNAAVENVIWTALQNVVANQNSIQKTSTCNGCDDAGAISSQTITSGDGYVEFTAQEINNSRGAGLSNGNTNTSLSDIDFGILVTIPQSAEVRENGVYKSDTPHAAGDVFRIAVTNNIVTYSKNGTVFYTSTKIPTYPLLLDASLWGVSTTIKNAVIATTSTPPDTTPPTLSNGAPSGTLLSGTTSSTLSVASNELATCKYGTTAGTAYNAIPNTFQNTGGTSHTTPISGLINGGSYTYYVRCSDQAGNANMSDFAISFSVGTQQITPLSCGLTDSQVHTPLNYWTFTPPTKGQTYIDSTFGCSIKRLTNAASEGATSMTHLYSSVNPFNADSTFIIIGRNDGIMSIRDLLNGTIVRDNLYVKGILPSSDPIWSRSDRNLLYFHPVDSNLLKSYNVATDQVTLLHTFSGFSKIEIGKGEGDISWDGDHIPVLADGRWGLIYTIHSDSIGNIVDLGLFGVELWTRLGLPGTILPSAVAINNVDVTPSNQYYAMLDPLARGFGIELWDTMMNYRYNVTEYDVHSDRTRDPDGTDVVVATNAADPTPIANCQNGIVKTRFENSSPRESCVRSLDWNNAMHISCNNVNQSTCLISTYSSTSSNPATLWPAYTNELFVVKLDGSQTVRVAHSRTSNNGYEHTPRAAINSDGRYAVFSSDMLSGTTDTYLVTLPIATPSSTPPRGGGKKRYPIFDAASTASASDLTSSLSADPTSSRTELPTLPLFLTRNLFFGSNGEDVEKLQTFFISQEVYPEKLVTGYFGQLTQKAAIAFQKKYGITPAVGFVGPITQARIVSLATQ